jgi:hypothetical protein
MNSTFSFIALSTIRQLLLTVTDRAVFVVRPARPRTQHDYHHDTKVKPEAFTAVIELLMMGGKMPETC